MVCWVITTIRMVPGLEDMGIQMLLNENHAIERGNQRIYLAGIDDAHFYRVTTLKRLRRNSLKIFQFCCRTRRRSINRLPMLILACYSAGIPMVGKSASLAAFRSLWICSSTSHGFGRMEVP